jgi:hypothetical protein
MERSKYLILILLCLNSIYITAQNSNKERIYAAYITGNMQNWKSYITENESIKNPSLTNKWELLEMYYGYIP